MSEKNLKEIILLVRGGAGGVSAAKLLASGVIKSGAFGQSMPKFDAERRGARFPAFVRISNKPIYNQYEITNPADVVICLEKPLLNTELIKDCGALVIDLPERVPAKRFDIVYVNAAEIARELKIISGEGNVLTNTVLLGAALTVLPEIKPDVLFGVIGELLGEKNAEAAKRGFENAVLIKRDENAEDLVKTEPKKKKVFRPFLDSCEEAGANLTGDWRVLRPVFTESCNSCDICVLSCPEGIIRDNAGKMSIDYDYCKGCSICFETCPLTNKGIKLIEENQAEKEDKKS
ncbi:MAG: 2-oxoacid:acceptor oxidoreductase family protein [bacterium]|nr:2-oxoacid:acceptor oxidoreductase family protein [bacterium]